MLVEEDVVGLHVPVDEALLVAVIQRGGDLCQPAQVFLRRGMRDAVAEGSALHVAQRVPGLPLVLARVEDRHDVRMLDCPDTFDLAQETPRAGLVLDHGSGGHLDDHLALQARVLGQVDAAHAALGQAPPHPVPLPQRPSDPGISPGVGSHFGATLRSVPRTRVAE